MKNIVHIMKLSKITLSIYRIIHYWREKNRIIHHCLGKLPNYSLLPWKTTELFIIAIKLWKSTILFHSLSYWWRKNPLRLPRVLFLSCFFCNDEKTQSRWQSRFPTTPLPITGNFASYLLCINWPRHINLVSLQLN